MKADDIRFVQLLAQGLTTKEIAVIIGCPKSTLDKRRWFLVHRMEAKNTCHLITICFNNGILIPLNKCCNPKPLQYEFINRNNLNNQNKWIS